MYGLAGKTISQIQCYVAWHTFNSHTRTTPQHYWNALRMPAHMQEQVQNAHAQHINTNMPSAMTQIQLYVFRQTSNYGLKNCDSQTAK